MGEGVCKNCGKHFSSDAVRIFCSRLCSAQDKHKKFMERNPNKQEPVRIQNQKCIVCGERAGAFIFMKPFCKSHFPIFVKLKLDPSIWNLLNEALEIRNGG